MNNITIISKLADIPDFQFTGYIWESDQTKPILLNNQTFDFSNVKLNPFIIEAYLYAKAQNQSIAIKHIDGQYLITNIDLSEIDLNNIPKDSFIKHFYLCDPAVEKQNNEFKYMKFLEYFNHEIDELCANLKVLKPAWAAFIGFSKEEWK